MKRLLPVCCLLAALAPGCRRATSGDAGRDLPPAGPWFTERAEASGLRFVHFNGMSGRFFYAEIIPPGAAVFDYDNDGDLDVFLVQGRMLGEGQPVFPPGGAPPGARLFRNDLASNAGGTGTLHFTDVTATSGIDARGYGMGAATGDINNDGCVDLYVTNLGPNQLFRNNCDGTFTDVSKASRTDDPSWSVSAAFLDVDRDGWLDLFSGNYMRYGIDTNVECSSPSGRPDYCSPNVYRAQPSRLYRNNRDGTFTDVTAAAGMALDFGPALGVTTADFNGDGWIDFYVANDAHENHLWINQHDGTFRNNGLLSGTALSTHGKPKSGMGVDAGDVDNDGDDDLLVSNLTGEGADVYVNDGTATFEEQSARSGIGLASLAYTGFGAGWLDADNDGRLDAMIVNGAVRTIEALRQADDPFPLRQTNLLFRNVGQARFEDATKLGGPPFQLSDVGRGAAFGDIDNDGDTDVVVATNSGPTRLLINNIGTAKHWLGLKLVGHGRDMLGARVAVVRADGSTIWRRARADGSYGSANDPRVLVGLGESSSAPKVRVIWPDGRSEEFSSVPVDRYTTLTEGRPR